MSRQGSPYPPSGGLQAATVLVKAGLSFSAAAELETDYDGRLRGEAKELRVYFQGLNQLKQVSLSHVH